jgi:CTP-dependent riboflavin kinase
VDGDIEPHELNKFLVVSKAKKGCQVGRVVLVKIQSRQLVTTIHISEDASGNVRELGDQVHGILESGSPILLLGNTILVGLGEGRVMVKLTEMALL